MVTAILEPIMAVKQVSEVDSLWWTTDVNRQKEWRRE